MTDEGQTDSQGKGVRSLSSAIKVLKMLDLVANNPEPSRFTDLQKQSGLLRSTVFQQLRTLVEAGYLDLRDDGRYQLSLRCVALSAMAMRQMDLTDRIEPLLDRLARRTHLTASLTMIRSGRPTIVQRVEAESLIVARQTLGADMSLLLSASGRVHISFQDPKALEAIAEGPGLDPALVAEIRERKIAYTPSGLGVTASATPVFDGGGRCFAALSIVGVEEVDIRAHDADLLEFGAAINAALRPASAG
ncbi:IclR family transcriptional regulator [Pseudooceanicola algae]|uniref:HTH-type transcriptional regulator XynR n=1 Tax=Pseudooceanicola algae TaxID=1537215 RepID=A0A418SL93_9RHOB|nr:IclR family transcriptional regulator [Pseudooceanicola algae]QPM90884.1 HTH-type transcriptional regulator XynR [Pseudooceanicola algae]